jgi:hypothetical protein
VPAGHCGRNGQFFRNRIAERPVSGFLIFKGLALHDDVIVVEETLMAQQRYDLVFETDRFNLSEPRDYFINDYCFGDDAAAWLRGKLADAGIAATEPDQEDWGWYMDVKHAGHTYFVGVGGNVENESSGDRAEWRLVVEKHRSFQEKLTGANPMTADEEIVAILKAILENEPDMTVLRVE